MDNKQIRLRKVLLTWNNPPPRNDIKSIIDMFETDYYCLCDEIGAENGTPHTHIFIIFSGQVRFSTIQKRFSGAHIDPPNGTNQECRDYIRKEGKWKETEKADTNLIETFEESGEMPEGRQGKRTDISLMIDCVKQGLSNYQIIELYPNFVTRIRDIDRYRNEYIQETYKHKYRFLKVIYVYGSTGTGKTRGIIDSHGIDNVYRVTDYDRPFDDYNSQSVLVFEEFRNSLPLVPMLNYLDIYPNLKLPSRYNNKIACYDTVYIVSNWDLRRQYTELQNDRKYDYNAFLRRIHEVWYYYDVGKCIKVSTDNFLRNKYSVPMTEEKQLEFDKIF